jgi:hypothetical protein
VSSGGLCLLGFFGRLVFVWLRSSLGLFWYIAAAEVPQVVKVIHIRKIATEFLLGGMKPSSYDNA